MLRHIVNRNQLQCEERLEEYIEECVARVVDRRALHQRRRFHSTNVVRLGYDKPSAGVLNLMSGDPYLGKESSIFKRVGYLEPFVIGLDWDFTMMKYPPQFLLRLLSKSICESLEQHRHGEWESFLRNISIEDPIYQPRRGMIFNAITLDYFNIESASGFAGKRMTDGNVELILRRESCPHSKGTTEGLHCVGCEQTQSIYLNGVGAVEGDVWQAITTKLPSPYVFIGCEFTHCIYQVYSALVKFITSARPSFFEWFKTVIVPSIFHGDRIFYKHLLKHRAELPRASTALKSNMEKMHRIGYRFVVISNTPRDVVEKMLYHVYGGDFVTDILDESNAVFGHQESDGRYANKNLIMLRAMDYVRGLHLAGPHRNFCYVGDSLESDYQPQHADVSFLIAEDWMHHMADFAHYFINEIDAMGVGAVDSLRELQNENNVKLEMVKSFEDFIALMVTQVESIEPNFLYVSSTLGEGVPLTQGTSASGGFDIMIPRDEMIHPQSRFTINVGFRMESHRQCAALLCDRSSNAKRGIKIDHGLLDADYRGQITISGKNIGHETIHLKAGERIAQIVHIPYLCDGKIPLFLEPYGDRYHHSSTSTGTLHDTMRFKSAALPLAVKEGRAHMIVVQTVKQRAIVEIVGQPIISTPLLLQTPVEVINKARPLTSHHGLLYVDPLAYGIVLPHPPKLQRRLGLDASSRGANGFGSTGL